MTGQLGDGKRFMTGVLFRFLVHGFALLILLTGDFRTKICLEFQVHSTI